MPRHRKSAPRVFQVGPYWLDRVPGSEAWYRHWYDEAARRTQRATLETADFEEAKDRLVEYYQSRHQPRDAKPEGVEIVTALLAYYDGHGQFAHDPARIRLAIDHLSGFFVGLTLDRLTLGQQRAYARHREGQGVSSGTWGRELSVARAAARWCLQEGIVRGLDLRWIDLPKGGQRTRVLEPGEFRAWHDNAEPHCRVAMLIMACTLCRPQAALDLTVFQCDRGRKLIDLNPAGRQQTKKRRPVVPMARHFLPLLDQAPGSHLVMWRPERPKNSKKVEGLEPLPWRPVASVRKAATRARERAGLSSDITLYTIRHTMATMMAERGVPDHEIRSMLGHTMPGVTGTYVHLRPGYLGNAVAEIDGWLDEVMAGKVKARKV